MNQIPAQAAAGSAFATESPLHDFEAILRSRTPLIAVECNEETQIVGLVRQIRVKRQKRVLCWTVTEGLQAFEPANQLQHSGNPSAETPPRSSPL